MTDLSPQTQAVLYATHKAMAEQQIALSGVPDYRQVAAAVLRAAADQVVPPKLEEEFYDRNQAPPLTAMVKIRQKLLAIAAELEGDQ